MECCPHRDPRWWGTMPQAVQPVKRHARWEPPNVIDDPPEVAAAQLRATSLSRPRDVELAPFLIESSPERTGADYFALDVADEEAGVALAGGSPFRGMRTRIRAEGFDLPTPGAQRGRFDHRGAAGRRPRGPS